jgi:cytochrome oxidase Cu insertion factor (SCO1/SenC/PrrC family)
MKSSRTFLVSFFVILIAVVALWRLMPAATSAAETTHKEEGKVAVGGAFTLRDTEGNVVTQVALKGSYALVFFGFTSCPDICPTSLQVMTQAIEGMGEKGDNIRPVFITVDPERDTSAVMKEYVAKFHPRFLALTGTKEQTDEAAAAYKVFHQLHNQTDKKHYVVDHSGFIYLMSPTGEYVTHFSHDDSSEAMIALLKRYVK